MFQRILFLLVLHFLSAGSYSQDAGSWIRVNQLGYAPAGVKVAVLGCIRSAGADSFVLVNAQTGRIAFRGNAGHSFGKYGPFTDSYRLDFSAFTTTGRYVIRAAGASSPEFPIGNDVYEGSADFCLRYLRQQRSGFNPFLHDSCHLHDGYTLYAPVADSTHIDVVGGWHDATDYLQYASTSANATWHLLAAYRDFPAVFSDEKLANGLDGKNKIPDVVDEAKWGLDWLVKMHPRDDWLFNQIGDDRDHRGMRIPKEDTNFYGRGLERPVYFCSGSPQVRGKYMNNTTGVASIAGKFASAFALGARVLAPIYPEFAGSLVGKASSSYVLGVQKPGACQTASVVTPYIYAEDNWTDDMELAGAMLAWGASGKKGYTDSAFQYALQEPCTPWFGKDTAAHYQWYPFVNAGHYELAKLLTGRRRDTLVSYYRQGIDRVWQLARGNAFYRGIPFIWCSNNLTVSFAIQCYWYRRLTGDRRYQALEQACFDWLFGCNPWGTSMVYGLPAQGVSPRDPHSSLSHLKNYRIDGGLVDGPVYTSIYSHLIGITLTHPDAFAPFQSQLAVYHDDYGDYSTDEPTMDGTASLVYLLAAMEAGAGQGRRPELSHGGIIRADTSRKSLALVFTGDTFGDGLPFISRVLGQTHQKASFFFTGSFYRQAAFLPYLRQLAKNGSLLGPHSDQHLLYCDWEKRDSLLVSRRDFETDLRQNLSSIRDAGLDLSRLHYFIPPFEWWNDSIALWSRQMGLRLANFTPGIKTNADYVYPGMGPAYYSSLALLDSLKSFEKKDPAGLNGTIILLHAGTDPRRTDKLYGRLRELIAYLKSRHYQLLTLDELLDPGPAAAVSN